MVIDISLLGNLSPNSFLNALKLQLMLQMKNSLLDISLKIYGTSLDTNDQLKLHQTMSVTLTITDKMNLINFGNDMRLMKCMTNQCSKTLIDSK